MSQRQFSVGTSPVLIAQNNPNRSAINVSMLPTSIAGGNTGIVYVGKGFVPTATNGEPNAGDPLNQGTQFAETAQFQGDPSVFKGQLWAIATTSGQLLTVDEVSDNASTAA